MKLFTFDPKLGRGITGFGSAKAHISRIAQTDRQVSMVCILLEPGGILGMHPATQNQLFVVVSGEGWIRSGDSARVSIQAFQAAFWEAGENHETSTDSGLTAIVIEGQDLQPHPYMREIL